MQTNGFDWPQTRWELSAPESYVLMHGPNADGAEAFKMAVLELVMRGALQIVQAEQRGRFGRRSQVTVLAPGTGPSTVDAPELRTVLDLYRSIEPAAFENGGWKMP